MPKRGPGRRETGMNWIRQTTRLAIYLRDDTTCMWCGSSVAADGAKLSLDHVRTRSDGGSNDPANLVTSCTNCNSSRGPKPMNEFARYIAKQTGQKPRTIQRRVRAAVKMALPRLEARGMIARTGSAKQVLDGMM